jgi:hypothetical protein
MNNKSLALNKPYENVVSIRYELWKIHVGIAIYAREDPPSLNAASREGFNWDDPKNTENFIQRGWIFV